MVQKALILDDDKLMRASIRRLLKRWGVIEIIEREHPDTVDLQKDLEGVQLIITDHDMGYGRTGLDFLKDIRLSDVVAANCLMALMSGVLPPGAKSFAQEFDVLLLEKPFSPEVLRDFLA